MKSEDRTLLHALSEKTGYPIVTRDDLAQKPAPGDPDGGLCMPPELADKLVQKLEGRANVALVHAAAGEAARYRHSQTVGLGPWDRLLALFGLISKAGHLASLTGVVLDKNAKIAEVRRSVAPESSGWTKRDWGEA